MVPDGCGKRKPGRIRRQRAAEALGSASRAPRNAEGARRMPGPFGESNWRPRSELNRRTRICSPLHNHSATRPVTHEHCSTLSRRLPSMRAGKQQTPAGRGSWKTGAGNETRTRDPDLGKVVLYQLSYSRGEPAILPSARWKCQLPVSTSSCPRRAGQAARRYSYPTTGSAGPPGPAASRRRGTPAGPSTASDAAAAPAKPSTAGTAGPPSARPS